MSKTACSINIIIKLNTLAHSMQQLFAENITIFQ